MHIFETAVHAAPHFLAFSSKILQSVGSVCAKVITDNITKPRRAILPLPPLPGLADEVHVGGVAVGARRSSL